MRKYGYISGAILAVALSACQMQLEESLPDGSGLTVLTATTGSDADTKSSLSPMEEGVSNILWSDNDAIGVFIDGSSQANGFSIKEGAGSRKASFTGTGRGDSYVAVYPYGDGLELDGETIRMNVPEEQEYVPGSFGSGSYPMVAVSSTDELAFKAVSSVLRLSLTGSQTVKRIVFRSNDPGIKVSGPATVSLADPSAPALTMSSAGKDSLVLNVGEVVLDSEDATDFFMVVPAQNYKGGFTVRVYTTTGYMDKRSGSDFRMERSRVHPSGVVKVKLTGGIETSETLAGHGTKREPFLISSLADLLLFRDAVNAKAGVIKDSDGMNVTGRSAHYLLTTDLDLSPLCGKESGKNWIPIGYSVLNDDRSFNGYFDGGGHEIRNLYINVDDYEQALFGAVSNATVRNLTVSGEVSAISYAALLSSNAFDSVIENCIAKGEVNSLYYQAGGLVASTGGTKFIYCRNEATVSGGAYVGGIAANCSNGTSFENCTNAGTISCEEGYAGGITGSADGTKIFDGVNLAKVEGGARVGGISGYLTQGAKVLNSINFGEVKGVDFVGGIAAFVSSMATSYQGPGTVANSVNLGKVSCAGTHVGWLASFVGLEENESPLGDEPLDAAWVKNSYWLKDDSSSIKGVGGGPGIVENVFALTEAQMKGAAYDGVLYTVPKNGEGFNRLIDALNAGAVEWSVNAYNKMGGDRTPRFPLSGWEYPSSGSYPSHSDLDAQMPGQDNAVFDISEKELSFIVKGGDFQVEVTSNHGYSLVSLPSWIRKGAVKEKDNRPHTHLHSFTVTANNTGEERKGVIEFVSADGASRKLKVTQSAPYLEISGTEFSAPSLGATRIISISSSVSWAAFSGSDWMKVSPRSGTGDGILSIIVDRNKTSRAREGMVRIESADGAIKYFVNIVQSGNIGAGDGNWEELPFYHQSLVFRFTATWCTWCPYMNKAIIRAQELYPGKIQQLALHCGGSDLQYGPVQNLMNVFKSNSYPTGIVDGRILMDNGMETDTFALDYIKASKETEEVYGTASGIALSSSLAGRRLTVDADAYFKTAGAYKITVLLVEDGIVHPQVNGGNDYVHDNVVRLAVTDILGESFTMNKDLSKRSFSYVVTVPDGCDLSKMRVFAYIQKAYGSAPKIQSDDYGDYYVDNCATVPLGESLKLALVGDDGGSGGGGGNEEIGNGDEIR